MAFQASRLELGYSFSLGLSFLVGGSILRTMIAPTWDDIGQLAAIIALRTVLNYLLLQAIDKSSNDGEGQSLLSEEQSKVSLTSKVTVCNGRYYGSGLIVAEDAAIDDQRLDLYSLEMENWWETLMLLPALMRGNYINCRGIRTLQGTKFELHTPKPCPMDIDGEAIAQTPAHFHLIPQALSVFVPD